MLARSAALHPKQKISITYEHHALNTKGLAAIDLDAKTPPKAISWRLGLLADSNASHCDRGIHTCFARTRAIVTDCEMPLGKEKKNQVAYT